MRVIEPLVQRPLLAEWERVKLVIARHMGRHKRAADAEYRKANDAFVGFLELLRAFRVLDPACGSGNFLYLAPKCLKDIEHLANIEAEALGLQRQVDSYTSPANVPGIELNEYAAELARVTVWIGELQWRLQHGYPFKLNPVLDPLDQIECRDALMNADGSEAVWPRVSVVVGNPPFVDDKKMRAELGGAYTEALRAAFSGRVPGGADLVCYWFEKARAQIELHGLGAAGLVATNSIRGGANRKVLDRVCEMTRIFEAWSDEAWVNNGAAVRVSMVSFGLASQGAKLDGQEVGVVFSDLSAGDGGQQDVDLARAVSLSPSGTAFIGTQKGGCFEVGGDRARRWLLDPNPHGESNGAVVFPWINGLDITRRPQDLWIVDFNTRTRAPAALFGLPWQHCAAVVQPQRVGNREARTGEAWWLLQRSRPELKAALRKLPRYIATARVAKHRLFVHVPSCVVPDSQVVVFARFDAATLGMLHSRVHEIWSLRLGSSLEDRPRYTPTTCFETFPFPTHLTPANTAHQHTETLPDGALIPAELTPEVRPHAEAVARAAKAPERPARTLAQPARMDAARARGGAARHECIAVSRPHPAARRLREAARRSHADQALQRTPCVARPGPRSARRRHGCGLRLARLHAADARRGNPAPAVGLEPRAVNPLNSVGVTLARG